MLSQQSGRDAYTKAHGIGEPAKTIADLQADTINASTLATGNRELLGRARYLAAHGDTRIRALLADHDAAPAGGDAA